MNRICARFAAPSPGSPGGGGGAGGADAAGPGRTGFISCIWPGAGAARGLRKFPPARALPLLSPPPRPSPSWGGGGVCLPQSPHQILNRARRWFRGGGGEMARAPRTDPGGRLPWGRGSPPVPWGRKRRGAADLKLLRRPAALKPPSSRGYPLSPGIPLSSAPDNLLLRGPRRPSRLE